MQAACTMWALGQPSCAWCDSMKAVQVLHNWDVNVRAWCGTSSTFIHSISCDSEQLSRLLRCDQCMSSKCAMARCSRFVNMATATTTAAERHRSWCRYQRMWEIQPVAPGCSTIGFCIHWFADWCGPVQQHDERLPERRWVAWAGHCSCVWVVLLGFSRSEFRNCKEGRYIYILCFWAAGRRTTLCTDCHPHPSSCHVKGTSWHHALLTSLPLLGYEPSMVTLSISITAARIQVEKG